MRLRWPLKIPVIFLTGGFLMMTNLAQAVTFQQQSRRLQLINAHLMDFRPASAPETQAAKTLQLGGEVIWQPSINTQVGDKKENIDSPPFVPRPRARYFATEHIFVGGSWVPPLEVNEFAANILSLEAGYRHNWDAMELGVRAILSGGKAQGPITEKNVKDKFSFSRNAVDISLGYKYKDFTPYAGVGTGRLESKLEVEVDGAVMEVNNHGYGYGFIGMSYQYQKFTFNFEQNQSEYFLRHFSLGAIYSF